MNRTKPMLQRLVLLLGLSIPWLAAAQTKPAPAPLPECYFNVRGQPALLVRGATREVLRFTPSDKSCLERVPATGAVWLRSTAYKGEPISGLLRKEGYDLLLELNSISRSVPNELQDWDIHLNDLGEPRLGKVRLAAGEISTQSLSVVYSDLLLDQRQDGTVSNDQEVGLPIAVVNPLLESRYNEENSKVHGALYNQARLNLPTSLPTASTLDSYWKIELTSWEDDVYFTNCRSLPRGELLPEEENNRRTFLTRDTPSDDTQSANKKASWQSRRCQLLRADSLTFEVKRRKTSALVIELSLRELPSDKILLIVPLTLAAQARIESLPLPISSLIESSCDRGAQRDTPHGKDQAAAHNIVRHVLVPILQMVAVIDTDNGKRVRDGGIAALNDDNDFKNGRCRLTLDETATLVRNRDLLRLYGPQTIDVTVAREGESPQESTVWRIESGDAELVLSPPPSDGTPEKPYIIRANVSEQSSNKAIYRPGSFDSKRDKVRTGREYIYEAKWRPRGPFGLSFPARYFITVPLNVTGLRFPANPRDLRSSSDVYNVQVTTLQAGVLAALEPWDYDNGRTFGFLPLRLMVGMNLVDLNNARFVPSILTGISVTAPLVDAPSQLGTSVALGAFWEVDLRDPDPLTSSRMLFTLGLNIFSLFAAK